MSLYAHQKRFLDKNPDQAILCHDAGLGKTRTACEWLKKRKGSCLIIAPRQVHKKWGDELVQWGVTNRTLIITTDKIKAQPPRADIIIVDEAHNFSSPLFVARQRSQRTAALYAYIQRCPSMPRLFLSASVIRSAPHNIHTLATLAGLHWDWKKFRAAYYELITRPYAPFPFWEPKRGWQKQMKPLVHLACDVATLSDVVDIPPQYEEVIKMKLPTVPEPDMSPVAEFEALRRQENDARKTKKILELAEQYRKVVIVARYTAQIAFIEQECNKHRETFVLQGSTKDFEEVVREARESEECFLIVQADMATGFELPEFPVMIFASLSYAYISLQQAKGRILRINKLQSCKYIYVLGGECDEAVYKSVQKGIDFDPHYYAAIATKAKQKGTGGDTKNIEMV